MLDFMKEYGSLFAFVGGSLSAYLLGLIVAHFRREKRWLGFNIDKQTIVSAENPNLTVQFNGHSINKLDSYKILISNIGNRSLIAIPVRLIASIDARILERNVEVPEGATASFVDSGDNEVCVTVDLLNVNEHAIVSLIVANPTSDLKLISRVDGLTIVNMSSKISTQLFDEMVDAIHFPFSGIPKLIIRYYFRRS